MPSSDEIQRKFERFMFGGRSPEGCLDHPSDDPRWPQTRPQKVDMKGATLIGWIEDDFEAQTETFHRFVGPREIEEVQNEE